MTPTGILCILDARGRVIEQLGDDGCSARVLADVSEAPSRIAATQVISPGLAFLMTSILSDHDARVLGFGEVRRNLQLPGRPAAAKTGTTEDTRDALTVGYTPRLVTGVWVGNADGTPMDDVTGVRGAAPIWQRFMTAALEGQPAAGVAAAGDGGGAGDRRAVGSVAIALSRRRRGRSSFSREPCRRSETWCIRHLRFTCPPGCSPRRIRRGTRSRSRCSWCCRPRPRRGSGRCRRTRRCGCRPMPSSRRRRRREHRSERP